MEHGYLKEKTRNCQGGWGFVINKFIFSSFHRNYYFFFLNYFAGFQLKVSFENLSILIPRPYFVVATIQR